MKYFNYKLTSVNAILPKSLLVLFILNLQFTALRAAGYEDELTMEPWMATPFEVFVMEETIYIEQWMQQPFDVRTEEDLLYEEWMGIAFKAGSEEEMLFFENWMGRPFDQLVAEEINTVETWMIQPFMNQLVNQPAGEDHLRSGCITL